MVIFVQLETTALMARRPLLIAPQASIRVTELQAARAVPRDIMPLPLDPQAARNVLLVNIK